MLTWPPVPTALVTVTVAVSDVAVDRFTVDGRVEPAGKTVSALAADGLTAVRSNTTAATPVAGTPPTPVTVILIVLPEPNATVEPPVPTPAAVSSTRVAVTGKNWPAAGCN